MKLLVLIFFQAFAHAIHPTKPIPCSRNFEQRFNTLQKISQNELRRTSIIQKMVSGSKSEFIRTVGYPQMPYQLQRLLYDQKQLAAMNADCANFESYRSLYNITSFITVIRDHVHSQHYKRIIPPLFFTLNPTNNRRNVSEFYTGLQTKIIKLGDIEGEIINKDFEGILYPYRLINKSAHNLRDDIEFCKKNTIEHLEETLTIIQQIKQSRCVESLSKTIFSALSSSNIYCIRGLYIPHNLGNIQYVNGNHETDLEKGYADYCNKIDNSELVNFLCDAYIQDARPLYDHPDVHLKYYVPAQLKNKINEILLDNAFDILD